jgi:hypothetical protein
MAQLVESPAVVTCGRTTEEAREMLLDARERPKWTAEDQHLDTM